MKHRAGPPDQEELDRVHEYINNKITETKEELNKTLSQYGLRIVGNKIHYYPDKPYPVFLGETDLDKVLPNQSQGLEEITAQNLKDYLDEYVIKQEDAKEILATKIVDHYRRVTSPKDSAVEFEKQNIIIIGSTGVGKTYIIKKIAEALKLPFAKVDATSYTAAGYVGGDVEDIIRKNLLNDAGGVPELAEKGIVYIDEIDKVSASMDGVGPDIGGDKVQAALLKLIEGKEIEITPPNAQNNPFMMMQRGHGKKTINTKDILFIVGGAFSRGPRGSLVDVIKERKKREGVSEQPTPFGMKPIKQDVNLDDYASLKDVNPEDFVQFGMGHEWIGRFPVIVPLENLDENALLKILKKKPKEKSDSLIDQYKAIFERSGITLDFEEGALYAIAKKAVKLKTGARSLTNIMSRILTKYQFKLENIGLKELVVTKEIVEDPQGELDKILENYGKKKTKRQVISLSEKG